MSDDDTETTTTEPADATNDRRFTQADVDRLVGERMKRARLDGDEIDKLRARAGEADRLEARLETVERERDQARHDAQSHAERATSALLRAEVLGAAARAGAIDPEDVFRLLPDGAVKFEDDKAVGADEAIRDLAERKAHLFQGAKRPVGGDGGARHDGGGTPRKDSDMAHLMRQGVGVVR